MQGSITPELVNSQTQPRFKRFQTRSPASCLNLGRSICSLQRVVHGAGFQCSKINLELGLKYFVNLCHVCHAQKRNPNPAKKTLLPYCNQIVACRHELHTCADAYIFISTILQSSDLQSHDISLRREFQAQHAAWQKL